MTSEWKTYIQVNIYDRTLQELHNEGICLEGLLKNVGCPKTAIVEISLPGGGMNRERVSTYSGKADPLSTTLANLPRFSTPLTSHHFTMNFTTNISRINSDADGFEEELISHDAIHCDSVVMRAKENDRIVRDVVSGLLDRVDSVKDHNCTENVFARAPEYGKLKKCRSVPAVKNEEFTGDFDFVASPSKRRKSDVGVCRETQWKENNLHSDISKTDNVSPNFHDIASPIVNDDHTHFPPIPTLDWDEPIEYSYGEDVNGDETLEIGEFTPPPLNVRPTASILKRHGKMEKTNKTVSFRSPQRRHSSISKCTEAQFSHEPDRIKKETIPIKCEFPDCGRTINWRPKFGKLRLLDHALLHGNQEEIHCQCCDFKARNTRLLRSHYQREHKGITIQKYGIKNMYFSDGTLKLYSLCFQNSLNSVGMLMNRLKMRANGMIGGGTLNTI